MPSSSSHKFGLEKSQIFIIFISFFKAGFTEILCCIIKNFTSIRISTEFLPHWTHWTSFQYELTFTISTISSVENTKKGMRYLNRKFWQILEDWRSLKWEKKDKEKLFHKSVMFHSKREGRRRRRKLAKMTL